MGGCGLEGEESDEGERGEAVMVVKMRSGECSGSRLVKFTANGRVETVRARMRPSFHQSVVQ